MRLFLYIALLFATPVYAQVNINNGTTQLGVNGAGSGIRVNYGFGNLVINDDGYYNAFPMFADAITGESTVGIYKKAGSHAGAGNLMFVQTTDGGKTYTESAIVIGGVTIQSTNHSFIRLSSGRVIIAYKTDTSIRFAYSDNNGSTWTQNATTIVPGTNYSVSPAPIRMLLSPEGKILFCYYQVGSNGNPASGIIMQSADNGASFTQKCVMYTHNTLANNPPIPDWRGNEIAMCFTHNTGVDATSKAIAIIRTEVANDGGSYFIFLKSADGGATWVSDSTKDSGSFVNDNGQTISGSNFYRCLQYSFLQTNSPVDIRLIGDSVYVVNGERDATYGYALKVISATPDGAYQNKFSNWTRPRLIKRYYDGAGIGSSIDCGYPVLFQYSSHLFATDYDVSSQPLNPILTTRRCFVETVKIK